MSTRILVTGGAGFIGSHLCARLIAEGHEVVCADNFFTGDRVNVEALLATGRFRLLEHDITQPLSVEADWIFNLACPASPVHYQADPISTVECNVLGALNVLRLAERTGARVLQASTSEVYGDPLLHPQVESYRGNVSCTGPRACYDEGKRVAETLFFDFQRRRGVDIRVARIFNTYGPRMRADDGRVVSNFVVQALAGEPLTVYGDGSQTRSFCYVTDLVDGLLRLMSADAPVGPVNLGNPNEFTVLQLARRVLEMTGSRSQIAFEPLPEDDPIRRKPDIAVARALGWDPAVQLHEGLRHTVDWFSRQRIAAPRFS